MASNNQFLIRLKRELTGSPKKAAMLGLLLLVAIWFWAPLVGKWIGKKDDDLIAAPAAETTAVPAATTNSVATTEVNTTAKQPTLANWRDVLASIHSDDRMQPREPNLSGRDPFAPAKSKVAVRQEHPTETAPSPVTPQQAGLVVNSIIVGPKAKTALINGRPYHEQQTVTAGNGHDRFVVVEIRTRSVVVDRNRDRFELKLKMVEAAAFDD